MRLNLFPTVVGLWTLNTPAIFDQCLYQDLIKVHGAMRTGPGEIWDRHPHDIFDGTVPSATQLARMALPVLQRDFVGSHGRIKVGQGKGDKRPSIFDVMHRKASGVARRRDATGDLAGRRRGGWAGAPSGRAGAARRRADAQLAHHHARADVDAGQHGDIEADLHRRRPRVVANQCVQ